MKKTAFVSTFLMSFTAFSAVELYSKNGNEECVISGNKVTKTISMLKGDLTATTIGLIKTEGLEEVATRAAALSMGRVGTEDDFYTEVRINEEKFKLSSKDSKEAVALIHLLAQSCK